MEGDKKGIQSEGISIFSTKILAPKTMPMRTIHSTRDLAKIGAFQVFTSKMIYSLTQLLNNHADATYVIIIYFLFDVFSY